MKTFVFVIMFGLAVLACAQREKKPSLPVLSRYIFESVSKAQAHFLHEPGFNPCQIPEEDIKIANKSIGALKETNIYGLSDFTLTSVKLKQDKSQKLIAAVQVALLQKGAGAIEVSFKNKIYEGKVMYYTPVIYVDLAAVVKIGLTAVQLQDFKVAEIRGQLFIDPLVNLPRKKSLFRAISRSYTAAADICTQKIVPAFLASVNKVLATRSPKQILQGMSPRPLTVVTPQLVTDAIEFTRKAIIDAKDLEKLQLPPLPISARKLTGNVTGQLLQLNKEPKVFYASLDPNNPSKVNVYIRYDTLPVSLVFEPLQFKFKIQVLDTSLHFQVLQTPEGKRITKITNFFIGSVRIASPKRIPKKITPVIDETYDFVHKFIAERLEIQLLLNLQ